jgi:voltage-gated potassium channel Kch
VGDYSDWIIHLAEREVQPEKFGTIPDAMWWSIVTLGTIGYGDVVPVTPFGKMIAAATILCGLVMSALGTSRRLSFTLICGSFFRRSSSHFMYTPVIHK